MKNRIRMISVLYLICLLSYSADAQAPVVADEDLAAGKLGRNIKIEQKGDNIYNIEFRNADIKDIMRFFAREYGLNIIADKDIEGTVTASLGNITIRQALKQILDSQNFMMVEEDNVIRVRTKPSAVVTFKINNVSAADIKANLISLLSSTGKMVIDEASNSIMVTDQDDNIRMIQSFLESVDKKGRQVLIEARFVETSLSAAKSLGIEWGTTVTVKGSARPHTFPFGSVGEKYMLGNEDAQAGETDRTNIAGFPVADDELYTFGTLDFSQFQAVLKALLTDQNTKVISNPKVATINNRAATMGVTTEYPLPTYEVNKDTGELNVSGYEYKDVGITLNVTPFITTDNYITMTIEPKVGAVGDTVTVGTTGFELPIISSKTATTKVTIKNGETIVIGGLISDGESKTVKKVPLLGSIPIIGKVFSSESLSKSSSELLIFVTPHIINLEGENELKKQKIDAMYREIDRLLLEGDDRGVISKAGEILKLDENEQRAMSLIEKAADRKIQLQNEQTNQNVDEQAQLSQSLLKEANHFYAKKE
ncbi:MAG: secretin N-terminal domain-containing protein [Candidatus Omnitrophica bacterium]|nr:secretin N-terminal domain-containing protein [Candidatus Omnitrophota bacterium]